AGGSRRALWYHPTERAASPPCQVYGINILVKLLEEAPAGVRIYCPKGSPIRYGVVAGRGDGFDEGANAFREMPPVEAVVAFGEPAEEVEGHYFYGHRAEDPGLPPHSVIPALPPEHALPPPPLPPARRPRAVEMPRLPVDRVLQEISQREVVDLTAALVRIPSVFRPAEPDANERAVALAVEAWLRREGFAVEVQEVDPGRP